ncbi:hypothetical protein GO495_09730 [Chitinophaga oryziterrae]|uniref:Uncharacterized protein n=1 Tax=Chitinophaga oryziterrae TaxID=1031224 RepID=A0A6N8J6J5_9BACT|nr:hypothetical protein [Chitinophaga oryziterrae]MVT40857.1 hypothetical protein [Chitinophaga oryziterrae]
MADREHYNVTPEVKKKRINFYFESVGKDNFTKAIKYALLSLKLEGRFVYNLGFGDYDDEKETLSDTVINNNGDVYKVFNTVLTTVPLFFEKNPDAILWVEGSDNDPAYLNACKLSCKKKCTDKCRNEGRRIALYCRFVDRNYSTLSKEYIFEGGFEYEGEILIEAYEIGKAYSMILVYKRN